MRHRTLLALLLASSAATAGDASTGKLITSPDTWNRDFTSRLPATEQCPGGSLVQLRRRMQVVGPLSVADASTTLSPNIRARLSPGDETYSFSFSSTSSGYWAFFGTLVARQGCVVHVEPLSYDN